MILVSNAVALIAFDLVPALRKGFLDIQPTLECGFTLKPMHDMTRTYSQMHCADKCPEESSMISQIFRDGPAFDYQLSDSAFEGSCNHLNFRYCPCFQLRVPWHSGNYRVWIHSELRT